MTNYIEEMMKTAGVELIKRVKECWHCPYYSSKGCCMDCQDFKYPDFTAEKQLELIKLIGLCDYNISIYEKVKGAISIAAEPNTFKYSYNATAQDFSKALAQLTTDLMNAGELDKEKVKEILEDAR